MRVATVSSVFGNGMGALLKEGNWKEYAICEQGYTLDGYRALLAQAGLRLNRVDGGWDGHPASEADEWFILYAEKAVA